jgi:hypothetical protein
VVARACSSCATSCGTNVARRTKGVSMNRSASRGADGIARVRPAEGSIFSVLSGSPRRLPPVSTSGQDHTYPYPLWAPWGHPSARNGARVMGHLSKRRSPNRGVDSRALPQVTACRSGPIQLSFPYGSREIARRWPDWCRVALLPSNSGCPQRNRKEVERAIPGCPSRDRGGVSTTPLHRLTTWPSPQSWVTLPWGRVGLARRRRAGYVSHQVVGW